MLFRSPFAYDPARPLTPPQVAQARAAAQAQAEALIHADPAVRALLAQFPTARIVPQSIRPVVHAATAPVPEPRTP